MGYGIHNMYISQRKRFFPLPDYDFTQAQKVTLNIYGHTIDENYSKLLIEKKDLSLDKVALLDRVQKKLSITKEAAAELRKNNLIEGRKPNYYVSSQIAKTTGNKAEYIKNRAFDKQWYKDLILKYIKEFSVASRDDLDNLLIEKLSISLSNKQKRTKIKNLIYEMSKKDKTIYNRGVATSKPEWVLNT